MKAPITLFVERIPGDALKTLDPLDATKAPLSCCRLQMFAYAPSNPIMSGQQRWQVVKHNEAAERERMAEEDADAPDDQQHTEQAGWQVRLNNQQETSDAGLKRLTAAK